MTRKDDGKSDKSTKISTEMPTLLPIKKLSTQLGTEKLPGWSPMLGWKLHHWITSMSQFQFPITAICPILKEDFTWWIRYMDELYECSAEPKHTKIYSEYQYILGCWRERDSMDDWWSVTATNCVYSGSPHTCKVKIQGSYQYQVLSNTPTISDGRYRGWFTIRLNVGFLTVLLFFCVHRFLYLFL
jgi:hypothetical protein